MTGGKGFFTEQDVDDIRGAAATADTVIRIATKNGMQSDKVPEAVRSADRLRALASKMEFRLPDWTPKHGFRIVGSEDALLETCEGEPAEETIGIYDDLATPCPRCGDKLVLEMGHSFLRAPKS